MDDKGMMKDRILDYLKSKNIKKAQFEREIGVSNGYLTSMRKGLGVDKIELVRSLYTDLNIDWLLTGEGEMLKTTIGNNIHPIADSEYMMVEYADLRASAGMLGGGDISQLPETHRRLVPKEYANGKFLVVGVDGDSMDDGTRRALCDGDEVLVYQHEGKITDPLPIKKTIFVITTREGNVMKQIAEINEEEQTLTCRSFNPAYKDFKIAFSDIYQIFIVCKIVQKQIRLI